jgi:hypothetical protein
MTQRMIDEQTKLALLRDEYLLLQKFYEDFDGRIITIKGWSATIGLAAIGVGFYQSSALWLFGAAASLVFWLLEALWKSFQYMCSPRIAEIERAFADNQFNEIKPLQIYSSWFQTFQKYGFGIFGNFSMPIVAFPHVLTVVAGVGLFALHAAGVVWSPH